MLNLIFKPMAKRTKKLELSEEEKKQYGVTPTEVSKFVNVSLMDKPNKAVVIGSFIHNVINPIGFVIYCVQNAVNVNTNELELLLKTCNEKIKAVEVEEQENRKNRLIEDIKTEQARKENSDKAIKMMEAELKKLEGK
jgi:hypothetical protein